ncbi:hypothetical protein C2G38_2229081 [Gigaspora rosea]|uniref:CCHC-type domain-containing protein n=1 Tax=Gigaspora rosea TaxID=44941 RepID=A0A397U3L1_9GLOM|nr:hypothetical protein C2G38_2229081 [Gigaspora rosea]
MTYYLLIFNWTTSGEPSDEYFNKIVQVFAYGGALAVAGFNDAIKAKILKSKMSGKYTPVPAEYPVGTNIDTPIRFLAWLRHKYHEETIGLHNASLSRLAQEKFNPTDTPQTYEDRIRLLLLQTPNNNSDALAILWTHLPDELFTRVKITNPLDINAFFTAVKDTWFERKPSTFTYNGVNSNLSVSIILSNTISSENLTIYKKAYDELDFIAQRLGYSDNASRDPDALKKFIEEKLYRRLGYANYNIQSKKLYNTKKPTAKKSTKSKKVERYCSMCGKPGYTKKNCPKVRKTKKINNITSSQYEYIDQSQLEEDIEYIINESDQEEKSVKYVLTRYISQCPKEILTEIYTDLSKLFSEMKDSFYSYHSKNYMNKEVDKVWENIIKKYQIILEPFFLACSENDMPVSLTSSNYCEKIRSPSLNYAIKQYQEAQLYQNWLDLLKIIFLQIKEPNIYATISCKVYDLEIPYALLDTGSDTLHIPENIANHFIKYFGLKIDRKKVYRLTGALGKKHSIGSFSDIPVTIGVGNDTLTISDEFSVLPTEKDNNAEQIQGANMANVYTLQNIKGHRLGSIHEEELEKKLHDAIKSKAEINKLNPKLRIHTLQVINEHKQLQNENTNLISHNAPKDIFIAESKAENITKFKKIRSLESMIKILETELANIKSKLESKVNELECLKSEAISKPMIGRDIEGQSPIELVIQGYASSSHLVTVSDNKNLSKYFICEKNNTGINPKISDKININKTNNSILQEILNMTPYLAQPENNTSSLIESNSQMRSSLEALPLPIGGIGAIPVATSMLISSLSAHIFLTFSRSDNNLFPLKKMLSKEMRNQVINKLITHFTDSPKLDKNCSIDNEGEHQTDYYWVLGPHCPLCRENHMSLNGKWWLDSQSKNTYYLHCNNLKEPGIPLDDVLKAYSGDSKQIQELKTQRFTIPIPWNNALILPDKSIVVEA